MIAAIGRVFVKNQMISKVLRLISGILILLVAVSPLLKLKSKDISSIFDEIGTEQFSPEEAEKCAREALAAQVRKSTEQQIETVAEKFGCDVKAHVEVSSEKIPQLLSVEIVGTAAPENMEELSEYLTQILGVPPGDQVWRLYETDR